MKKLLPLFILSSLLLAVSCGKQPAAEFSITNPASVERPSGFFTIKRETLKQKLGELTNGQIPQVRTEAGDPLLTQLDDIDGDGRWDVLAGTLALKPNQTRMLEIVTILREEQAEQKSYTNIRFANIEAQPQELKEAVRLKTSDNSITQGIFQMEGPAWENDKVAFRNYFDARNGYDIFGKTTSAMAMDKAGLDGQNYHELSNWGMDILKVGASLGAGGTGYIAGDTLIRIGASGNNTFRLVREGPVRSMFDLHYTLNLPDREPVKISRRICIRKGEYGYRSRYSIENALPEDTLITGLVNKYNAPLMTQKVGEQYRLLASHAQQSVNEEYLGMAVLMPEKQYAGAGSFSKTHPVFPESHYAKLRIPQNGQLKTFFFAGWEESNPRFSEEAFFLKQLKQRARELENYLKVQE